MMIKGLLGGTGFIDLRHSNFGDFLCAFFTPLRFLLSRRFVLEDLVGLVAILFLGGVFTSLSILMSRSVACLRF